MGYGSSENFSTIGKQMKIKKGQKQMLNPLLKWLECNFTKVIFNPINGHFLKEKISLSLTLFPILEKKKMDG